MNTLICKIPPDLLRPFVADGPKGGKIPSIKRGAGVCKPPLWSVQAWTEGERGDFLNNV